MMHIEQQFEYFKKRNEKHIQIIKQMFICYMLHVYLLLFVL